MHKYFNAYSHTNPELKVKELLIKQLLQIHVTSNTTELFGDDAPFIHDIIVTNIELDHIIEHQNLDDIIKVLGKLRETTSIVSKKLKTYQRSSNTATPRNIYLNQLHSAYGIFILELNSMVQQKKIELEKINITNSSFEKIMNEPYIASTKLVLDTVPDKRKSILFDRMQAKSSPRNKEMTKTPNNLPESSFCCCGMSSQKIIPYNG